MLAVTLLLSSTPAGLSVFCRLLVQKCMGGRGDAWLAPDEAARFDIEGGCLQSLDVWANVRDAARSGDHPVQGRERRCVLADMDAPLSSKNARRMAD